MINEIIITDLAKAESYSFSPDKKYDVWITAIDSKDKKIDRMKNNFLSKGVCFYSQYFADWSDEDSTVWSHLKDSAPTKRHIENYINFLKPFIVDDRAHNLGVNCFAGISRSSALAIIALVMSGKTIDNALDYVLAIRPEAWPNLRMLRLASEFLGKDIKTHVEKWKKNITESGVIVTSYDDLRKLNKNEN